MAENIQGPQRTPKIQRARLFDAELHAERQSTPRVGRRAGNQCLNCVRKQRRTENRATIQGGINTRKARGGTAALRHTHNLSPPSARWRRGKLCAETRGGNSRRNRRAGKCAKPEARHNNVRLPRAGKMHDQMCRRRRPICTHQEERRR